MKYILFIAIAIAGIHVANQPAAQTASVATLNITPTCLIRFNLKRLKFSSGRRGATASDDFTMICDVPSGANVSLETKNGGLKHQFFSSIVLGYTAKLSSDVVNPLDTIPLVLIATGGNIPNAGDNRTATLGPLQIALANPQSTNANIKLTLNDRARIGGRYKDTLRIIITPN